MSNMFDAAIDHFWRAQQGLINGSSGEADAMLQIANGLQLFCAAVKAKHRHPDVMFDTAIDHFWRAQRILMKDVNKADSLLQVANGLQLFCAATKRSH
jgi:hypothetical protein